MNREEKIIEKAEKLLDQVMERMEWKMDSQFMTMGDMRALSEIAEHLSTVIWNVSNAEEAEADLTDQEVEDGIL